MKKIFEGNKLWAREANARDPLLFRRMAAGQSPKYLYFGCSDSRVPATDILGLRAGEARPLFLTICVIVVPLKI